MQHRHMLTSCVTSTDPPRLSASTAADDVASTIALVETSALAVDAAVEVGPVALANASEIAVTTTDEIALADELALPLAKP